MRMFREFEEAQAFADAVTKASVIERVESHAAQRRLKQMNEFADAIYYGLIAATVAVAILAAFCLRGVWIAARRMLNKGEGNAD